jgi:hypothetical protein
MSRNIHVSTSQALYQALENAEAGDTILLGGGNYGDFTLNAKAGFDLTFPSDVTIKSLDVDDPAVFTGMALHKVENLSFDGITFDYTFQEGDTVRTLPFLMQDSADISIVNSTFDGDRLLDDIRDPDGLGTGIGLSVRASENVVISGNEFFDFHRGAVFSETQNLTVSQNDVYDMRSDGFNFVEVTGVLIEENYIHDFRAAYESGDHRDMIQFWTNGTSTPSSDIVIRNNQLDIGEGSFTQSIFMRNEAVDAQGGGEDMFYQNVLIEENHIYNGHLHGITVGETDGLTIRNNTIVAIEDDMNPDASNSGVWIPAINVKDASTAVVIQANATSAINADITQSDWTVKNNAYIQNTDPYGLGYYDDVFITSSMGLDESGHAYIAKPDQMLAVLQAGATALHEFPAAASRDALFDVQSISDNENTKLLDASLTAETLADAGIINAQYLWTFEDGHTATGVQVAHEFSQAGAHDVALSVVLPNGTEYTADGIVDIRGGAMLSFDGDQGSFKAFAYGEQAYFAPLASVQDGALQLGAAGSVASVDREVFDGMRGSDALDLDFTFSGSGTGEIFRMHGSFIASINVEGELVFQAFNSDNQKSTVESTGLRLNDGQSHEISINIVGGSLELHVDGQLIDDTDFSGSLPTSGSWDLVFGNPWGRPNFEGEISSFEVAAGEVLEPLEPFTLQTYHAAPEAVDVPNIHYAPGTDVETNTVEINTPEEDLEKEETSGSDVQESLSEVRQDRFPVVEEDRLLEAISYKGENGEGMQLTGNGDHVDIGRLREFEDSEAIGFTVDFEASEASNDVSRLIWNHLKLGLTLTGDELLVQAATADEGFKSFKTEGLELAKGELHTATVLVDGASDRLQLIVNNEVVLDVDDTDFDIIDAGGHEWGWTVGTPWHRHFVGDVAELQVSDRFEFQEEDDAPRQTADITG